MSASYSFPPSFREIPACHNVTGTCGKCGGPIISPMFWSGADTQDGPPEWCMDCGAKPKQVIYPAHGPVREME